MRSGLCSRLFFLLLLLAAFPAQASVDVREFRDPVEEARYRALVDELRCPKCQNTNLAGSDAGLADDLKDRVYKLLREGRSDDEIRTYLIDRYGDFITYKPPLRAGTVLLWCGPFVLLFLVAILLVSRARRQQPKLKPLNPDEKARLQRLLAGQTDVEPKP